MLLLASGSALCILPPPPNPPCLSGPPQRALCCGHTFCELCLVRLLAPLCATGSAKLLGCPLCKLVCSVPGGRPSSLPMIYAVLGE